MEDREKRERAKGGGPRADRDRALDLIKGIGILLVVVGHVQGETGPELWLAARRAIFSVHVPLFFVVGGYLFGHARARRPRSFGEMARRNLRQLGIPFVVFSLIAAAGTVLAGPSPISAEQVGVHFVSPTAGGFAFHLWFLYSLLVVRLLYPLLLSAVRSRLVLLVLGLAASSLEWPWQLTLRLAIVHLPLFVLGDLLFRIGAGRARRGARLLALPALAGIFWLVLSKPELPFSRFVPGAAGALVLWIVAAELAALRLRWLEWLGRRSLAVYLWHTMLVPPAASAISLVVGGAGFWAPLTLTFVTVATGTAAVVWAIDLTPLAGVLHGSPPGRPQADHRPEPGEARGAGVGAEAGAG